MKNYQTKKEQARQRAIDYQASYGYVGDEPVYYSDIMKATELFVRLGKRYGLTKEFKENGII